MNESIGASFNLRSQETSLRSQLYNLLQAGDIILKINDVSVYEQFFFTTKSGTDTKLDIASLFEQQQSNKVITIKLLRAGSTSSNFHLSPAEIKAFANDSTVSAKFEVSRNESVNSSKTSIEKKMKYDIKLFSLDPQALLGIKKLMQGQKPSWSLVPVLSAAFYNTLSGSAAVSFNGGAAAVTITPPSQLFGGGVASMSTNTQSGQMPPSSLVTINCSHPAGAVSQASGSSQSGLLNQFAFLPQHLHFVAPSTSVQSPLKSIEKIIYLVPKRALLSLTNDCKLSEETDGAIRQKRKRITSSEETLLPSEESHHKAEPSMVGGRSGEGGANVTGSVFRDRLKWVVTISLSVRTVAYSGNGRRLCYRSQNSTAGNRSRTVCVGRFDKETDARQIMRLSLGAVQKKLSPGLVAPNTAPSSSEGEKDSMTIHLQSTNMINHLINHPKLLVATAMSSLSIFAATTTATSISIAPSIGPSTKQPLSGSIKIMPSQPNSVLTTGKALSNQYIGQSQIGQTNHQKPSLPGNSANEISSKALASMVSANTSGYASLGPQHNPGSIGTSAQLLQQQKWIQQQQQQQQTYQTNNNPMQQLPPNYPGTNHQVRPPMGSSHPVTSSASYSLPAINPSINSNNNTMFMNQPPAPLTNYAANLTYYAMADAVKGKAVNPPLPPPPNPMNNHPSNPQIQSSFWQDQYSSSHPNPNYYPSSQQQSSVAQNNNNNPSNNLLLQQQQQQFQLYQQQQLGYRTSTNPPPTLSFSNYNPQQAHSLLDLQQQLAMPSMSSIPSAPHGGQYSTFSNHNVSHPTSTPFTGSNEVNPSGTEFRQNDT